MTNTQRFDPELDLLLKLRESISNPAAWGQCRNGPKHKGAFEGAGVGCLNDHLVYLAGYVGESPSATAVYGRMSAQARAAGELSFYDFNDTRTHTEVLALLDACIAERTSELTETA